MPHLSISLLGTFEVLLNDKPVGAFESDKVRALLTYLAVRAGQPQQRSVLAGLLWPERPDRNARQNLSQALFNLRQALGDRQTDPPFLIVTPRTLQFNQASAYRLDTAILTELAAAAKSHPHSRLAECDECLARLQQAVSLYRGDFLTGLAGSNSLAFEEWALLEREHYHRLMMEVLATLTEAFKERNNFEAAIRSARRWVSLNPWQEEAHHQLMRLLVYNGQHNAALAQFENCRRILAEELGVEPSAVVTDLCERIKAARAGRRHRLRAVPHSPPLIGREQELAQMTARLANPACRLLCLVGPGGIGKTRLALEFAATHGNNGQFLEGVCFIPLEMADSAETLVLALADALRLPFQGAAAPKEQVLNYLQNKELLLILDSFEHLLSPRPEIPKTQTDCAALLPEILTGAPAVKILVTSRVRLNLRDEWLLDIPGLAYPPPEDNSPELAITYSAIRLFLETARRIRPDISGDRESAQIAARICRLVDGLPLAIELASTWARDLSYQEIAAQIEQGLGFLVSPWRDMPARHQNIQAVFDHSWKLLTEPEQAFCRQLTVFRGGFGSEAARQVTGAPLPLLSALVDKSFLHLDQNNRYNSHNLIRRYATEKLHAHPPEVQAVQHQHADYYMTFLQQRELSKGGDLRQIVGELSAEADNIRTGWNWAIGQVNIDQIARGLDGLWSFYEIRGWFQEGANTFRQAATRLAHFNGEQADAELISLTRGRLLARQGWFYWRLSRYRQSKEFFQEALAVLESVGGNARLEKGFVLRQLGLVDWHLGRYLEARNLLQQGQAIAIEAGDGFGIVLSLFYLGLVALSLGEYPQARVMIHQALDLSKKNNEQRGIAHWQIGLAWVASAEGNFSQAISLLQESLAICRETDDLLGLVFGLNTLGGVIFLQGDYQVAGQHYQQSRTYAQRTGDRSGLAQALAGLGNVACVTGDYNAAAQYLRGAVDAALPAGLLPEVMIALTGLARLKMTTAAGTSEITRAAELLSLVQHHPAGSRETKDMAACLLDELESRAPQLPPRLGTGEEPRDLEIIVAEFLGETLGGSG